MLSDTYHEEMRSNRHLEKNLASFELVQIEKYQAYLNTTYAILQMCDICGLKRQTKYLIKKSLDTYILSFPCSTPEELEFAALNFFRLAIKANEDPSLYDEITIDRCMRQVSSAYTRQDFINFELQFYGKREFNFNFTTPYHYMGLYASIFPMDSKQIKKIHFVLDFSFTIPELMFKTAQQLFFGAMLMVFQQCPTQKVWILSQTFHQQEALKIAQIIFYCYQEQVQAASNAQFQ